MTNVLVLNSTYQPLQVTSVRLAVTLLLADKAETVEAAQAVLRSQRLTLQVPLVIRLVGYVRLPRGLSLPLTRRNVLLRDRYTCQYCGRQPGKETLTLDHVTPRSRGGETVWENVVAACGPCNRRKADRMPVEASLRLRRPPRAPRYIVRALLERGKPQTWRKYLP
ncbi:MAG: HNH endonuclease [Chloroflexi bacterium]|nr:HNH endonuclease [Chloroflexota bacterium]